MFCSCARISQFFQRYADLHGIHPDAAAKAGDDLAGGDVGTFFMADGVAVVHQDQFACGVGRLETAVRAVQFFDFVFLEPVAETVVEQMLRLCVKRFVGDACGPGIVDRRDFERQPAAVAGVVGEELEVVARCAERGHVRQVHLVAPVGGTLVHVERGGHGLELVQFAALHGVDLLEVDEQVLGHGEEVVLREPLRVGLGGVVAPEDGRQEVLEERRLEASLPSDQDEDDVVHHLRVERGGDHPDEPAAETEVETRGVVVDGVHHCGQVADRVRHAVPWPRLFEKLLQRVVAGREVGEQERAQVEKVRLQPVAAHGAPEGVLDRVVHGRPAVGCGAAVGDGAVFE